MGLNLSKLAEIAAAARSKVAPVESIAAVENSAEKTNTLAALSALVAAPKNIIAEEVTESAGTISFSVISNNIISLEAAIKSSHPSMPRLLQDIWTTLNKYPEQVTLLAEDEMEVIISGLEKLVDTDLAAITIKSATSAKKSKIPVSMATLGF